MMMMMMMTRVRCIQNPKDILVICGLSDRQVDLLCASVARFLSGLGLYTFERVPAPRRQTRIL